MASSVQVEDTRGNDQANQLFAVPTTEIEQAATQPPAKNRCAQATQPPARNKSCRQERPIQRDRRVRFGEIGRFVRTVPAGKDGKEGVIAA